ncbi:MAG: MG2 domain-containing protein, partial [Woeseiaceae bacterium]
AYLYVIIEDGLRSEGDFVMSRLYDTVVRAGSYPKEATIAQSGAILPLTSTHRLTFVSRGVDTLKVELGRLLENQVNHLASQTGGDVKSPYFNNYLFNEDNLTARSERFIDLNAEHPKKSVYSSLDLSGFLPDGGYYFVSVQGWDRENDRPIGSQDKRFILITDLGLLVKSNADSTQDVFVHSIATGQPVAGARVALLGKNGVPIIERTTAIDGHVSMPATDAFERERTPTVFVVRLGADSVFMPYARHGRMLQYSRFDVGGEHVRRDTEADRLRAQVFTDRGLYRPGDTAKFAAIVKRDDWQPLGNLPLVLNVRDPRGQTVMDKHIRLPDGGFLDEEFATEIASPTGNYRVTLYLIEEHDNRRTIGSESFKVEEFLPDRLRIRSTILGQKTEGWLKPGDLVCEVSLENLFGTPAESRRVTGQLQLTPSSIRMRQHAGYEFVDPLRVTGSAVRPVSKTLAPTTTNQQGIAELPLDVSQYDKGIYRLTVSTEGFEEGDGRGVKAQASVMMSPLDYLIGYKTDSDLSYLDKESEHSVEFLAVDSDAGAIALDGLTLAVSEEKFVSTLVRRPNGTYAYQSILKDEPISSQSYAISESGSDFALPTDQPGRFVVEISDKDGLVFSKVRYTVAGARNLAGNLERDAELDLVVDGTSFAPGEAIEMQITAPYTGTGLITIERDRVYAYKWFQSDTNTSVQTIRVPRDLEGNAYVNVAFV